ncbi:MAG: hypothetical protein SGI99_12255 [Pseudomonadota bacterium]|nr:hypothetical protein [Pseudomonadota bacterium]
MRMAKELIIASVGLSDEQAAHLRLLIRKVAKDVPEKWRWGTEIKADLVVVDPNNFAGHMARTRAAASGMRCAILCDNEHPEQDGLILREPLKAENIIDVLKQASAPTLAASPVNAATEDFYFRDLSDLKVDTSAPARDVWGQAPPSEPVALGLDELLKEQAKARARPSTNPVAEGIEALIRAEREKTEAPLIKKLQIESNTSIAATSAPSARAQARMNDSSAALSRKPGLTAENPNIRRILDADNSEHSIRDYLDGERAIITPSQILAPDAPALTLDPKNQVFHAAGGLSRLVPYCSRVLPTKDWKVVTTRELGQLRTSEPARPFNELVWLQTLLKSTGRLASHLDPGGTYRLKGCVSAEPEFRDHAAIITFMSNPARLNEIAADAGASMDAVFNLVNAYDMIGLIEWTPRQRRHDPSPPEGDKKSGLLGKLGWPFGKKS